MTPEQARHYLGKIAKMLTRYHSTGEDKYAGGIRTSIQNIVEKHQQVLINLKLVTETNNQFAVPATLPKLTETEVQAINQFIQSENKHLQDCLMTDFFKSTVRKINELATDLDNDKSKKMNVTLDPARASHTQLVRLLKQIPQCSDQELSKKLDAFLVEFGKCIRKTKAFEKLIADKKLFEVEKYRMKIPQGLDALSSAFLNLVKLRAEFQSLEILTKKLITQGSDANLHTAVYSVYYLCTLVREGSKEKHKKGKAKLKAAQEIAVSLKEGDGKLNFIIRNFSRLILDNAGSGREIDIALANSFEKLLYEYEKDVTVNFAGSILENGKIIDASVSSTSVADTSGGAASTGSAARARTQTVFGHMFGRSAVDPDVSGVLTKFGGDAKAYDQIDRAPEEKAQGITITSKGDSELSDTDSYDESGSGLTYEFMPIDDDSGSNSFGR